MKAKVSTSSKRRWTARETSILLNDIVKAAGKHVSHKLVDKRAEQFGRSKCSVQNKIKQIRKENNLLGHYTRDDDNVIRRCVKLYPYNLQLAFADAAAILKLPASSIEYRYYSSILPAKKNNLFAILAVGSHLFNRKNIARNSHHQSDIRKTTLRSKLLDKLVNAGLLIKDWI